MMDFPNFGMIFLAAFLAGCIFAIGLGVLLGRVLF
jgi:hypothetical protein